MSIERTSNPGAQKAVGAADGQHAKAKGSAGGGSGAPAQGGFLSLLNAVEADASAGADTDTGASTFLDLQVLTGLMPDATNSMSMLEASNGQNHTRGGKSDDAGASDSGEVLSDVSMLLASQFIGAGGVPAEVSATEPKGLSVTAQDVRSTSTRQQITGDLSHTKNRSAVLDTSEARLLPASQAGGDNDETTAGMVAKLPGQLMSVGAKNSTRSGQTLGANVAPDWRDAKDSLVGRGMDLSTGRAEVIPAALVGEGGYRPSERASEKGAARLGGVGLEGALGAQALFATARVETPSAVVNAALPSPEILVAEQVSYWISNDVQNAELTMDGLGQESVEVSIALRGNEAQVAFRSDQAATRDLLEMATPHLKELLKTEGLLLSGVSVGVSSQQEGQNPRERQSRQGARQMSIMAPESVAAQGTPRTGRGSGQAVDLFV